MKVIDANKDSFSQHALVWTLPGCKGWLAIPCCFHLRVISFAPATWKNLLWAQAANDQCVRFSHCQSASHSSVGSGCNPGTLTDVWAAPGTCTTRTACAPSTAASFIRLNKRWHMWKCPIQLAPDAFSRPSTVTERSSELRPALKTMQRKGTFFATSASAKDLMDASDARPTIITSRVFREHLCSRWSHSRDL